MTWRPRINCLIPNPTDATSLFRAVGPLSKLKHVIDCEFTHNTGISWATLAWCDILFIQRPWGKAYRKACEIALTNNIPVWIDFDDNLLDIPDWNPAKKNYQNKEDQEDMIEMLKMASVITTTTEYLRTQFLQYNQNVFIIPNAFDDYMFTLDYIPSKKKIINWRGSNTHLEDLRSILPSLRKVQNRLDKEKIEYGFHFIGDNSDMMKGLVRHKRSDPVDPIQYFHLIKHINPSIQLVPLVDLPFNHAKSNIGWLEGVYSGAVVIAPKYLKEFNRPGCLNYSDVEEFEEILYASCTQDTEEFYKQGYEYIDKNLRLSKINELRKSVVEQLIG